MKQLHTVVIVALGALNGCANLNTLNRSSPIPPGGVAIHLDAPQRLAYTDGHGKLCTEPTPDALQSYASALGLGLAIPAEGSATVSNALAANAASIGLHTQSITLMRDGLYRICEAYFNGGLSKFDVGQLMRRSQDLTLAALAIEQLTGAVVARQAMLTNGANADAAANAVNTAALLDQARKDLADKEQRLADANKEAGEQQTKVDNLQSAFDSEPAGARKDELKKQLDTAKTELSADKQAAVDAEKAIKEQKDVIAVLQSNLASANATARAAATGGGKFAPGTGTAKTIDKDTAKEIARATQKIVQGVLDKDHRIDACISVISQYADAATEKLNAERQVALAAQEQRTSESDQQKAAASLTKSAAESRQKVAQTVVDDLRPGYTSCLEIIARK